MFSVSQKFDTMLVFCFSRKAVSLFNSKLVFIALPRKVLMQSMSGNWLCHRSQYCDFNTKDYDLKVLIRAKTLMQKLNDGSILFIFNKKLL